MADNPLRQLLAEFLIEIDPGGQLAKGNEQIEALKAAAGQLEAKLKQLSAAAKPAGKAVAQAFNGFASTPGLAAAIDQSRGSAAAGLFGQFGAAQGGGTAAAGPDRVAGPTRDTLTAHLAEQTAAAEKAAGTFQGRLKAAYASASKGADAFKFSGKGLLDTLFSLRSAVFALGAGAVVHFASDLVKQIADIGDAAPRLGVTTDEFQRLRLLAEQSGTSVEALGPAFRTLGKNAVEPTKESAAAFKLLNISTKDAAGQFKSRQDLFFDTATALSGVSNETQRADLAQRLFGRGALELLPLLNEGKAGLDAQREALAKMSVVSEETVKKAKEFDDRWKGIKADLLAKIAPLLENVVIPALEGMASFVEKVATGLEKFVKQTDFVSVALAALGAAAIAIAGPAELGLLVDVGLQCVKMLTSMGIAAGRLLLKIAPIVLAFLALEDVIGFFRGDDSAIGDLFTAIFGEDGGKQIQQAAQDITEALKELWDWVTGKGAGTKLQELGQMFSEFAHFLGKDINEGQGPLTQGIRGALGISPNGILGAPGGAAGGAGTDSRTQNVTVHVGSTGEVAGAVQGSLNGLGRDPAANMAAVGGPG